MFKLRFKAKPPIICIQECEVRHCPKGFIAKLCYTFTGYTPEFDAECCSPPWGEKFDREWRAKLEQFSNEELLTEIEKRKQNGKL